MLQITANDGAVFGPFTTIEKLEDRYDCDSGGTHLPFTVVGDDCVIEEYVPPPDPMVEDPAPQE